MVWDEGGASAEANEALSPEEQSASEADLLYSRGMAYYRRRQWREARKCFMRLKVIQSERRGIDALLDELNIFIQLEEIQPERRPEVAGRTGRTLEAADTGAEYGVPVQRSRRVWPVVLASLFIVAAVAFAALYAEGMLPFVRDARREGRLRNLGQAYLVAGNYRGAINVFEELLSIVPGDREAEVGLAKAYYEEAMTHVASRDWQSALEHFLAVQEVDPNYRDVEDQITVVSRQMQLESLFSRALSAYQAENWVSAIELFMQVRVVDETYRTQEVQRYLFDSHYRFGLDLVATSGANLDQVREAMTHFDEASLLNPADGRPAAERELAETYLEGCDLFDEGYWERAVAALSVVCVARPEYAGGRAAQLLCQARLNMARAYEEAADLESARGEYELILSMGICDQDEVAARATKVSEALTPTATPSNTPTLTPTVTRTPVASATPSHTPTSPYTATPLPTQTPVSTSKPKPTKEPPATKVPTGRPGR
jgi:tetratricopeptide (TPR) repeat protein